MTTQSEKNLFTCEEHKKCHETLYKIVKEGTQKPNNALIGRLTKGVSSRVLHKSCLNTPWKKEFSKLIEKEAFIWERRGGATAKKLKKVFQDIVKSGSKIEPKIICKKANVKSWYLNKSNLKYYWQKELYALLIKEQKKWEKFGGSDNKRGLEALKIIIENGERPTKKVIEKKMNKSAGFLGPKRLAYPWQKCLANAIEKADKKWQKKGGIIAKKFHENINKNIQNNERPILDKICAEVGYSATNIIKPKYPWQINIKTKLLEADQEWQKSGGKAGATCRRTFQELVKAKEKITPRIVSRKAGFHSEFLSKNLFEWKKTLLKEIEEYTSQGLTEVHILYIDKDFLIEKIKNSTNDFNNYNRLGISVTNPKTEIVNYFTLSHIMYSSYNHIVKGNNINRLFIDPSSYKSERNVYIIGILNACEGMTHSALVGLIPRMVLAAEWMKDNIPRTIEEARNIFYEYSFHLHKLLKSGEKKHAVSSIEQKGMISILAGMFLVEETEIIKDYYSLIIPNKAPATNAFSNTAKFTQENLSYAFSFYFHFFDQIADFLLEKKNFPHKIQLPRGHAIIMGLAKHLVVPFHQMDKHGINCIDPITGQILTDLELQKIANKNNIKYFKRYIKQKAKNLQKLEFLNSNKSHGKRLQLGKKALDAWFMCMLYLTSTNDSILGTYEWSKKDEYETFHDERKEFITIKPRAENKTIRFTIPKAFMPSFKKAIQLRKFVLNGKNFKYLFFQAGFGENARTTRSQFSGGTSSKISREMQKFLDSMLPLITSRDLRKDSAKDALSSHNTKIALSVLQNNKSTLINHYNGFTAEELGLQIHNLLNTLHKNAINLQPIPLEQKSTMGGCNNSEKLIPKNFHEESPIDANCYDPKSCIFCNYFITFPEKEEIRKLISLKYIIENIAYDRAEDESFYEETMTPWLKRIQAILDEMIKKEPFINQTINVIQIEVYNDGLLSPYWLDWIKDLDELGRLS